MQDTKKLTQIQNYIYGVLILIINCISNQQFQITCVALPASCKFHNICHYSPTPPTLTVFPIMGAAWRTVGLHRRVLVTCNTHVTIQTLARRTGKRLPRPSRLPIQDALKRRARGLATRAIKIRARGIVSGLLQKIVWRLVTVAEVH
jgi:hypothetical protein